MQFSVVSTFAGCGSSLGYKLAGGDVRLAVEWDDNAVETYRLNFPDTTIHHGDIAKLSGEEALELSGLEPGELDVFDGSPPCQGFSTAGKRMFHDTRNSLFLEYARLLEAFRPKVFIMENVSGLVKGTMKLLFVEILKRLKACGYGVSARLMDAMYFNVPQSRPRLIFVGVRNDLGIEPSHPNARSMPTTVRSAFDGLPVETTRTFDDLAYEIWTKAKPLEKWNKYHPKNHWFTCATLDPERPACTVLAMGPRSGMGVMAHWLYPRNVTIPEMKRLQSFPDDYKLVGSYINQWSRVGNSVPPNFMRAIAEHIRDEILTKVECGGAKECEIF